MKLIEMILNSNLAIDYTGGSDYLVASDYEENYLNVYIPAAAGINMVTATYQRPDGKKLGEYQLSLITPAAQNTEDNTLDKWGGYIDSDPRVLAIPGQIQLTIRCKIYDETSKLTSTKATPSTAWVIRESIASTDDEITEVEALTQVVSNTLEEYKSTVNSNTARIAQNEDDIDTLQEDDSNHEQRIASLETQQSTNTGQIANLVSVTATHTANIRELTATDTQIQAEIDEIDHTQERQGEKINANVSEILSLKTRETETETQQATNTSDISTIKTRLDNIGSALDVATLKTDVATLKTQIASVKNFDVVAADLNIGWEPDVAEPNSHTIYLTPATPEDADNAKNEWLYTTDGWELIGTTAVDLSAYQTKTEATAEHKAITDTFSSYYTKNETDTELAKKQDKLTADQLSAVNSGITADKVSEITANTDARHTHDNKTTLDTITAEKVSAWDTTTASGIDATKVAQIATNTSDIAGLKTAIQNINSFSLSIVSLDATTQEPSVEAPNNHTIYLTANTTSETNNSYTEWLYTGSNWEKIGTTAVDLSAYQKALTTTQLAAVNSGITSDYVSGIEANTSARHTHSNKTALDSITSDEIQTWNGYATTKQSVLTTDQLQAVNSGITADLVANITMGYEEV